MSKINYQALRERYSPQPVPKCRICGDEMTVQRICGSHITYGCTGATYDDKGCYYAEGRSIADDHYGQSRVTVIDVSDPEVLALLDEREAQSKRIAEMETNLAALAAENARLKVTCEDRRRFIMKGVQLGYIKVPKAETDPDLETIRIAISPQKPTPATDVFLAEVRAWAFNDLCAAFVRHAKVAGLDDADTVTLNEATDALLHCVEQLRAPE